jgi:protein-tyrosine phosphatase
VTALDWEGCVNVRDLGGLPTEDGRRTRSGVVVRSDNIRALTDEGWRSLHAHGVTRIVDLRTPYELGLDSPREVELEVVHVCVLELPDPEYEARLNAYLDSVEDVADHYAWSYLDFLERWRANFGRAVAAVADAPGPVVVHCAGGKDRTGLVTALVLRVAGVSREEVAADYARSEANLAPSFERWLAETDDELALRRGRKLARTPGEAMLRVLEELEARYGSVEEYLRAAGVGEEQLARLRERLVAA